MWILNKWLSEYKPTAIIVEGKQGIIGARVFSENEFQDSRYVYVSRMRDFFPQSATDEILLMHSNDVISLLGDDPQVIINSINEAFAYYNQWEIELAQAALSDTPEQAIIDACKDTFGPMFVVDLNFNLLAFSKHYGRGEVNNYRDEYILENKPSKQTVHAMRERSTLAKLLPHRHNRRVFNDPEAAPFSHSIMVSYLDDDALVGQLVISSSSEFGKEGIQLARSVEKALNSIQGKIAPSSASNLVEALFVNLVEGVPVEAQAHEKLMLLRGWTRPSTFCIVCCEPQTAKPEHLRMYKIKLSAAVPDTLVVSHGDKLVGLLRCASAEVVGRSFKAAAEEMGLSMGVSLLFSDLHEIALRTRQAAQAAALAKDGLLPVVQFQSCALHAITHSFDQEFVESSLHPTVKELIANDSRNSTEYAATLRCFLQNERSYQQTAEALFVHRNTVLYRIQKLQELYAIDLDNPEEREYILLSFRMLD